MKKLASFILALMLPASLFAATIAGTVTTGATGGAGGTPIPSAKVVLIRGGAHLDSATTGADGKYSFTVDTTGFRQIQATATGYNAGNANVNVASDTGTYTSNINLTSNAPGSIAGKVVKASDSSALSGARVILSRQGGGGGGGFTSDTTLTGGDGTYAFASVPSNASYTLNVSLAGYTTLNRNGVAVAAGQAATQNFTLAPPPAPGSIAGKVVKASDSSALSGARVILSRQGGGGGGGFTSDTTLTGGDGTYTFASVPANTNYALNVSLAGYTTLNRNGVTVAAGQAAAQNFALAPPPAPGSITGKVVKASDSSAFSGARVILSRLGGGGFLLDTATTDAQGNFAFDSIAVGTNYTLTVSAAGFTTETRGNVAVTAGKATTENFTMAVPPGPGSIAGKVSDAAGGAAIAGARVILTRAGGGGGARRPDTVMTDAQGMYAFDSVANQGNYALTVSATGFGTAENNSVDVAGGLKTTVNFPLTAVVAGDTTGTIRGVVTNASTHAVVAGARVILSRVGGGGGGNNGAALDTVLTDAAGAFSFSKLTAPGNYRLTVSLAGFQTVQSNTMALAKSGTFIADLELAAAVSLISKTAFSGAFQSHWLDGRLVVDLAGSAHARTLMILGADGAVRHRMPIAPEATRLVLPSDVRPGAGTLLRMEN